ncbi:hypothetical protein MTR67_040017 [Solanum verrucosum]|uniref:Uncharacterized protein n=1 Tax=Solanum verrucosum TaxID=315347 RepID=A0AAF0UIG2_SOLVR|nr:hypothetical protein MTR67_040017 [Solanum verrucosum]
MLKKCMGDPSLIIPTEYICIKDNLSYEEIPIEILDHQVRKWRTKEVASVKVLWRNQFVEEATWDDKEDMKKRYPHLFPSRDPDQGYGPRRVYIRRNINDNVEQEAPRDAFQEAPQDPTDPLAKQVEEDPQEFIDEVYKVLMIMGVTPVEKEKLTAYQIEGVSHVWFNQWKE